MFQNKIAMRLETVSRVNPASLILSMLQDRSTLHDIQLQGVEYRQGAPILLKEGVTSVRCGTTNSHVPCTIYLGPGYTVCSQ
jgi:hypothetical protein